jgi:hypothetical protein
MTCGSDITLIADNGRDMLKTSTVDKTETIYPPPENPVPAENGTGNSKKPTFRVGQKVKMINCPEGDHTPDKIWTIRAEPYLFEGRWRVLLSDWVGSFPAENITAASDEPGGISS